MSPLPRRAFLLLACAAIPRPCGAGQRRRQTKEALQLQLKAVIIEAIQESNVQLSDTGAATVDTWAKRGADRLVTDQSEGSMALAAANAGKCGRAIGDAARTSADRTATREVILGVFQKICPIYPFC